MKNVVRVASLAIVLSAVGISAPAFAAGGTSTTLTVTGNHTTITSGKSTAFTAAVVPAKVDKTKITGTVNWVVTSRTGVVIPCTSVTALTGGGKSKCKIDKGILLAGDGPFTAVARYGGDGTFDPSTGTASIDVTSSTTRVKIELGATPTSGAATTVTATVVDGPATSLVTGNVVFTITSQYHTAGVAVRCSGSLTPAASNNVKALTTQVAVCDLPAGWMIVPRATSVNPKPQNAWSVSAVYNGNSSFVTSYAFKRGTAKF